MRRKISVLLAEDNMDHAELILEGLQEGNEQFIVQHVKDGETAILYLLGEEQYSDRSKFPFPDLVILDIKMPKKTGLEVLEVIKTTGALKKIPVLILSTSKKEDEIIRAYGAGACTFLTKPIEYEEFIQKLSDLKYYWALVAEVPENAEGKRK